MDGRKRLPDAELSVMQAVWAHGGEVSRGDIEGALASHGWSINTINTYMTEEAPLRPYYNGRSVTASEIFLPVPLAEIDNANGLYKQY